MGCSDSKIKNEEAVTRCLNRKLFIQQAVAARNAFAAAHSSYSTYLKSTGAALFDFIEGEIKINYSQFSSSSSVPPPFSASQQSFQIPPPPPPPLPHSSPLQRFVTMPEIKLNQPGSNSVETIIEEEESDSMNRGRTRIENEEIHRNVFEEKHNEEEVVAPPVVVAAESVVVVEGKGSSGKKKSVNVIKIFNEVDDHFLNAFESANEVSKMLEATRMHYHSNFADNKGHIDHSARVMQVITWNRSFRGIPNLDDGKYDFALEEQETHATVLDKLLAWEKKLYDEVRAGELMKFEYQKKVALLNKLKKKGTNSVALENAKAVVSHLHTRYIVDMQSLDSTISQINRLRDQVLYRRLAELVDGILQH
ncbi:hypothetical protein Lalb_Chr01g0012711 [Lupinus albus]|uniref:DUF632 domain-containing protein n=1 Tax=Lupinus albus TaxID=3870 RepID=A0A6A4R330_LUPAL|nr:hypothetical protein Lalb_Chr01g0012711 [Lupinus albus]